MLPVESMTPILRTLALAVPLALAAPSLAQSVPDWAAPSSPPAPTTAAAPPTPPGGGAAPSQVPIDGGLGLLALAGGAYAIRRLRG